MYGSVTSSDMLSAQPASIPFHPCPTPTYNPTQLGLLFLTAYHASRPDPIPHHTSPGEALFYPEDYWHQTVGLDSGNAALSGSVVTPSNGKLIADELQANKSHTGQSRVGGLRWGEPG